MRKNEVLASRVKVDRFSQIGHRHDRTFDVPTRETPPPRAEPLHEVIGILFPEREVSRVALVIVTDDLPYFPQQLLLIRVAAQLAVTLEALDAEIDPGGSFIGVAPFDQLLDSDDLLSHMLGRLGPDQ